MHWRPASTQSRLIRCILWPGACDVPVYCAPWTPGYTTALRAGGQLRFKAVKLAVCWHSPSNLAAFSLSLYTCSQTKHCDSLTNHARPASAERVYLSLYKVVDTPFQRQRDVAVLLSSPCIILSHYNHNNNTSFHTTLPRFTLLHSTIFLKLHLSLTFTVNFSHDRLS